MAKLNDQQLRERARLAAIESAPSNGVGDFLSQIEEEQNVTTFVFAAKMKGYVGWTWTVSLFTDEESATVSEVNLMPGEDSLVAPNWVPWAERLADYKALQAELEAAAAEEAEDAEDAEEAEGLEGDSDDDSENEQTNAGDAADDEGEGETESDSATTLTDESPDAEQNADDTGGRVPRFLRRRLGRLKYKK